MQLTGTLAYLLYAASLAIAVPLEKRDGSSYTSGTKANDIKDGVCAPVTFIFARGTTEIGNIGETVGPALAKKLISGLGRDGVAIQGVEYPASILGNAQLGKSGGPTMVDLAKQAKSSCPDTKIVLSGYSQGGLVTHYAAKHGAEPDCAVLYGDPEYKIDKVGDLDSSKVKSFCATGDGVCELHTFDITAAHLSYTTGNDISEGAEFIQSCTGAGSSSSTSSSASESSSSSSSGLGGIFG